jgi:RNA polymerase sigma-70 factor (ECF subfamily)
MPVDRAGQSFDEMYVQEFPFVWRSLRGLGVRDGDVDDAAQEVFVTVHRRLSTFRGESALRTWLFGIVRNVAFKHRRQLARKPTTAEEPAGEPLQPGPSPLERAQDNEAAAFVQRFLARLNDKKREIFVLAVLEEMNMAEVAAALSIPLNTAYTRLRSVRADFQKALTRRRGAHHVNDDRESHR